ncbi:COX assembly mitochondrial protein 2 homolog [Ornithodoros turicata]|uniref:COX assembly mitochondrial protein 2 homolog n=1 Tax=Ornithodoros turicata TaxID=34597 RepID=UPI0031387E5C
MHVDLSEHLHTDECNILIRELMKCHEEQKFGKIFGACNSINTKMLKCLKEERLRKQRANYERSLERQRRQKLAETAQTRS